MEPTDDEPKKTGKTILETLDAVIDDTGDLIGGTKVSKIAGGAALGVLAAVVLPVSLGVGALVGGVYAAWRQSNR